MPRQQHRWPDLPYGVLFKRKIRIILVPGNLEVDLCILDATSEPVGRPYRLRNGTETVVVTLFTGEVRVVTKAIGRREPEREVRRRHVDEVRRHTEERVLELLGRSQPLARAHVDQHRQVARIDCITELDGPTTFDTNAAGEASVEIL